MRRVAMIRWLLLVVLLSLGLPSHALLRTAKPPDYLDWTAIGLCEGQVTNVKVDDRSFEWSEPSDRIEIEIEIKRCPIGAYRKAHSITFDRPRGQFHVGDRVTIMSRRLNERAPLMFEVLPPDAGDPSGLATPTSPRLSPEEQETKFRELLTILLQLRGTQGKGLWELLRSGDMLSQHAALKYLERRRTSSADEPRLDWPGILRTLAVAFPSTERWLLLRTEARQLWVDVFLQALHLRGNEFPEQRFQLRHLAIQMLEGPEDESTARTVASIAELLGARRNTTTSLSTQLRELQERDGRCDRLVQRLQSTATATPDWNRGMAELVTCFRTPDETPGDSAGPFPWVHPSRLMLVDALQSADAELRDSSCRLLQEVLRTYFDSCADFKGRRWRENWNVRSFLRRTREWVEAQSLHRMETP